MNQPMGRLEALQFREAAFYTGDGRVGSIDVLRIHFRAPDADYYQFDLQNGDWQLSNKALQFLANWNYRPSQIGGRDETMRNCHDDKVLIPLAVMDDGTYGLSENAMQGARKALENAEWFASDTEKESSDDGPDAAGGGGGPDPGTGNRGGVEEPSEPEQPTGVSAEMAPEDSDKGVTVNVS